jgi:4,5-epoxidase
VIEYRSVLYLNPETATVEQASVLVVGAGPTGLTLACGLLQQGVAIVIVDQAVGPAT